MTAKRKTQIQSPESAPAKISPQGEGFTTEDFKHFSNMSRDIHLIVSDKGKILNHSENLESITGFSNKDLGKKHFIDLFDKADRDPILAAMQSHTQSQSGAEDTFECEGRIVFKNGDSKWMRWKQHFNAGNLYCIGRDIEAEKEREKHLIEAESIGRMGHWQWVLGKDKIEWSDEIYRIFGVEKHEFEPTLEAMNARVHRADIMRVNQVFERAIIEENNYDMEFRIERPDGETRFIHCEGRCSFDKTGEVVALFGIMQDLTERMLYEHDLRAAKEQAEHAYAARAQFLANMSHELRTPLNAIIGFSEMIERQLLGPIGTEKYLEYIGGIRESGEHLLDLISDILDMSKIEAGKYELDLEEVSIGKIIKLSAHMMEGRAHDSEIKIKVDKALNEDLKIIADRRAILQICLNLLSNAVKFSKEKGVIQVKCIERENYLSLKVIDNGIGIPANKLANITRPFEQVSSSYARDHEGSGLGLSITKDLTEMHGGSLFIESKIDVGTTVTIRLPYDAHEARKLKKA